ncbi:unnamed protein product [Penicillium nalgiovense]|uniref:Xylanolytic transcriptional activator regulatory domain-containing protein n=1 Tax=Penicillium nalgiovense TaxID=60175 RepID=A0A9W4MS84_PENNA|nr:unnamed protein product [Penicillium nalgiovense]CAG7987748.1 unnamed protein product [Penicillium nalgiovense]CAG8032686.1 unnamed protein product [Penicillium nalgiovense]CAG8051726.1 unnamed protein product [Penicillium nalgiovense]CAG8063622.1 unnamed protein product [Penicillium nalgiovense]
MRKKRCSPVGDGHGCELCRSLSIPCGLDDPYSVSSPSPGLQGITMQTSREVFHDLVLLYFRFIHNVIHTMIHEASFMHQFKEGTASMIHVYAMCALAARFSDNPVFHGIARGSRGSIYISEAVRLIQQSIIIPSLESMQGLILIGYYYGGEGDGKAKHIYTGLARLHAETLSLWEIPKDGSLLSQEEHRRTWLSVNIASDWSAIDISVEPISLNHGLEVDLLKFDDIAFQSLDPGLVQGTYSSPSSPYNMWAYMARTLGIFNRTSVLLRQMSQCLISFDDYCQEAVVLEDRLDEWEKSLPPNLRYTTENIMSAVKQRLGRTFLAMHIGYHHFRQILFFPSLDARRDHDNTKLTKIASQCKRSANIISDILRHSTDIENCDLNCFIYGHIAVISSCVHLHTLLLSDKPEALSMARQWLLLNFKYLMGIKSYWPVVEHSVARLRKFQNCCQDSASDPFVLDNWMARFVTEHTSYPSERQNSASKPSDPGLQNTTARSIYAELYASDHPDNAKTGSDVDDLSHLLYDQQVTTEALVNHALDWLLE